MNCNQVFKTCLYISLVTVLSCSSKPIERQPSSAEVIDPSVSGNEPAKIDYSSGYVLDGGRFSEKHNETNLGVMGGRNGLFISSEKFGAAPVGKVFFVVTDESPARCVKSQFIKFKGRKVLLAYPKSPVAMDFCVYQKSFSEEGTGFSLFLKGGPTCRPSVSGVVRDREGRRFASVEEFNHDVSITYCVENTISWGEAKGKKRSAVLH